MEFHFCILPTFGVAAVASQAVSWGKPLFPLKSPLPPTPTMRTDSWPPLPTDPIRILEAEPGGLEVGVVSVLDVVYDPQAWEPRLQAFQSLSSPFPMALKNPPLMQETPVWPQVGKIPWRRKWQPTPVFLPGKSNGQRSLAGYSPKALKESDTTEHAHPYSEKTDSRSPKVLSRSLTKQFLLLGLN